METTENYWISQEEANRLAYACHKDRVESELKRIMIWIREKSALGLLETDQVIVQGKEVVKYIVSKLIDMKFRVSYNIVENSDDVFRLNIKWMWVFG